MRKSDWGVKRRRCESILEKKETTEKGKEDTNINDDLMKIERRKVMRETRVKLQRK